VIRRRNLIGVALIAALALAGCDGQSSREAAAPGAKDSSMIDAPAAPTRTGYAETNGARIYYQVHGDLNSGKTPLLVLHGSYVSAESMAPLVARFAATRHAVSRRRQARQSPRLLRCAGREARRHEAMTPTRMIEIARIEAARTGETSNA
jgi:hypothetical protein